MDNYLASGRIADATNFVVNFNFEFLKGCPFNCRGCFVNKGQNKIFEEEEFKKLDNLLMSLEKSLYRPFIAFVGPTDFLVSDNIIDVLKDEKVQEIFHSFKRLSFQTTYLNIEKAQEVADAFNTYYPDNEIEINIVVDPSRIMDDRYLGIIEKNKLKFLSLLNHEGVRSFGIMNVYDYDQTKIANLLRDYEFMHKRVEHLFETTIDYNFSLGRKPDLTADEFKRAADRIKSLFNQSVVSSEKAEYLRFSFGKLTDSLIEKQYNYLNGKIYFSPLLYERFVSFNPGFLIPVEQYNAQELELYETMKITEQYSYTSEMDECETCDFLGSCVDRGILFLMKNYGVTECLVAKDALNTINNYGTSTHEYRASQA